MIYVFGEYELDISRYELRQAGEPLQIEPKVFDLLAHLIQRHDQAISKDELLEHLWPEQYVSESALTYCIMEARKAVGDSGRAQRVIKTVRGRGYRFIAPVQTRRREVSGGETLAASGALRQDEPQVPDGADTVLPLPSTETVQSFTPGAEPAPDSWYLSPERRASEAERRQLTVLVCRVVGAPAHSVRPDLDELHEVMRHAHEVCTRIIRQFEGYIAQQLGDGLVIYFGYPWAHEDDAHRAVHTGLGIVEGIAQLNRSLTQERGPRLAVRVGIHTGSMVMGAMASGAPYQQLALGDTPTIAAQLQGLAKPDTVVISPATLQRIEGYFVCRTLGAFLLDEGAQPLLISQVLQATEAQSRLDAVKGLTPLVGREQEVGLLLERWELVKEGRGQMVVLSGEAGIGKSRLVHMLTAHMAGEAQVQVVYRGSPYYRNSALYPVITQMQQRLQLRRDTPPQETLRTLEEALQPHGFPLEQVVPLLAVLLSVPLADRYPPLALTPQRQKQKTFEVLLAWLLKEAEQQMTLVVWEDLQWMDPSTLEFLDLLIDQVPTVGMLMLLTCRPDFRPPWTMRSYLTPLTMGRLPRPQVGLMIKRVAGDKALPAAVVQQLVDKADGVPLFVEELTKMVLESGLVKEWEGRYELTGPLSPLAIPATLQDSLMARLDRLGPAKQVAQLGATVGREFAYEVIQRVAPMDETTLQSELERLVHAELLFQRGLPPHARYLFKHVLIQEAAYESLLRRTRRQYHKQIAQVLEEQFPEIPGTQPELLAHHYTGAGLKHEAIAYWQQAGQRATERSAHVEAIGHLSAGLELLKTLPDTPVRNQQELALQLTLGKAMIATKGYAAPEVGHAFRRARTLCQQGDQGSQHFPVLVGLWNFYIVRTELQTARALAEQCFRLGQRMQNAAFVLEAHFLLGATLLLRGAFPQARVHLERFITLYDPQQHGAYTFHTAGNIAVVSPAYAALTLWLLGYPEQARQKSDEALALAREVPDPYSMAIALSLSGWLHQWLGEEQTMQEFADEARALTAEHGFPFWGALATILLGKVLFLQGREEVGMAHMQKGLAAYQATGAELLRPKWLCFLVEAYGQTGRAEEGLRLLAPGFDLVDKHQEHLWEAELHRMRGELLLAQAPAQDAAAESSFQQALDVARQQQAKSLELRAAMSRCRLWQRQGKRSAARQLLAEVYEWFTEGFDTADLRAAKTLLEELGEGVTHAQG